MFSVQSLMTSPSYTIIGYISGYRVRYNNYLAVLAASFIMRLYIEAYMGVEIIVM